MDSTGTQISTDIKNYLAEVTSANRVSKKSLQIAEHIIEVNIVGNQDESFYTAAMSHLLLKDNHQAADLSIYTCDQVHCSDVPLPPSIQEFIQDSEEKAKQHPLGATYEIKVGSFFIQYKQQVQTLTIIDYSEGIAINWVYDADLLMEWEKSFPFRSILYYWFNKFGYIIIHGGAIGTRHGGVILAGKSGSGKSTATLACLGGSLKYVGDDIVLVHLKTLIAYSLYNVAKLEVHQLKLFPTLANWVSNPETMESYKANIFIDNHQPEWLIHSFPIKAILLPRFLGRIDTTIIQATAADAAKALFPSSMEVLTITDLSLFRNLSDVSRRLPNYWIETGTDTRQIYKTIETLLTTV